MTYEPPTKGIRYLAVDIGGPAVATRPFHVRNKIPYTEAHRSSHERLSAVGQALLDFEVRRGMLNEWGNKLVIAAEKTWTPYPADIEPPKGYAEAGLLQDNEVRSAAYRVEALISLYLEGIYIVRERMWDAAIALRENSDGLLWPTIIQQRFTAGGAKVPLKENLFALMEGTGKKEAAEAALFRRAIKVRGARVHLHHYQVDLIHYPAEKRPVVSYKDVNPYQEGRARYHFTDIDRGKWSSAMIAAVEWFCDKTEAMLAQQ